MDETFPTTLEKLYALMFADEEFIEKIWTEDEKLKGAFSSKLPSSDGKCA